MTDAHSHSYHCRARVEKIGPNAGAREQTRDGRKKPGAGGASFMKFGRARATQRMRIGSFTLFLVAVQSFEQFRHHPEQRSDSKQSWLVLMSAASAWGKEFASFYQGPVHSFADD